MGIDPSQINDVMRRCMDVQDRQKLATTADHPNAALTSDEAIKKQFRRLERQEQRTLASWLTLQEEAGVLVYDWSATNRRVTCRIGFPDFKVYRRGRVLFGEMKIDKNSLSDAQRLMHDRLLASGTEVQIWDTADTAIRLVKNWLWTNFRVWQDEDSERS
jgi:hypothetical protein